MKSFDDKEIFIKDYLLRMEGEITELTQSVNKQSGSMSKTRKLISMGLLFLLLLMHDIPFSVHLPFLSHEIVQLRGQEAFKAGILAGTLSLAAAITCITAAFVSGRMGAKNIIWWTGVTCFLSSIVFVIPMKNNILFGAAVFLSRCAIVLRVHNS